MIRRLWFYIKLWHKDPNSPACPLANARGILFNGIPDSLRIVI